MVDIKIDIDSEKQVLTCDNCGEHVSKTQKRVSKSEDNMIDPYTVKRCDNCNPNDFDQDEKYKDNMYASARFDSIFKD